MIVQLSHDHTPAHADAVCDIAEQYKLTPHVEHGAQITVVCIVGTFNGHYADVMERLRTLDGVDHVIKVSKPYKLASRMDHRADTIVRVGDVEVGGNSVAMIAGPCAIESEMRMRSIAGHVKAAGAHILRGGAYKPRTSPYSFRGLGVDGLKILHDAGAEQDMPVVTEVMDPRQVAEAERYVDLLQVGARNMQNFNLLDEVGQAGKPVLLKRGMSATVEDLLLSAEYIMSQGNKQVILCERGIRTFEGSTRNTFDISAVPNVRQASHLPIIVDPTHATGRVDMIPSMALAGIAAGAHGIHVEVHDAPKEALSDGPQALLPHQYAALMEQMRRVAEAIGKTVS